MYGKFTRNAASKIYSRYLAFTLAEVLITLAIVGVVAAMTMPVLITKYQKKVTAVRIKKGFSMISQAIKLSEVENGNFNDWDFGSEFSVENTRKFVKTYITPYIKELRECSSGPDYSCTHPVSEAAVNYLINNGDGISILAHNDIDIAGYGSKAVFLLYDIHPNKGKKGILGKDYFYFVMHDGKLLPFGYTSGLTREDILSGKMGYTEGDVTRVASCKKEDPGQDDEKYRHGCTALLYVDGWEFKDDYPW